MVNNGNIKNISPKNTRDRRYTFVMQYNRKATD